MESLDFFHDLVSYVFMPRCWNGSYLEKMMQLSRRLKLDWKPLY